MLEMITALKIPNLNLRVKSPHTRGIIKSCGLANKKGWRILVGDQTYEAVRSRKENTPWTNIPHTLLIFEPKSIQP